MIAETFDTGLDTAHARLMQEPHLCAREIGLYFVEDLQRPFGASERRQHIVEVLHVKNIVYDFHIDHLPAIDEVLEFVESAPRTLTAERHGPTVQSAKCAVRLRAPPTAARCLKEKSRRNRRRDCALLKIVEVVAE